MAGGLDLKGKTPKTAYFFFFLDKFSFYEMALMQTMWYNEIQNASVTSNFLHETDILKECILAGMEFNYVDFFS